MKVPVCIFLLLSLFAVNSSQAKMVEYVENIYLSPAPDEITKIVHNVAEKNFDEDYEVTVPKKAGMQINPWNKFIASAKNPATGNLLLIINPEWFSQLFQDEKTFLIVRAFLSAKNAQGLPIKIVPWVFFVISILTIILLTLLLGKIQRLSNLKRWMRIVIAMTVMAILNLLVLNKVQLKILEYLAFRQTMRTTHLAIQRSGVTKDVAINALSRFDVVIKDGLKSGESFWKPFETAFEKPIQALQEG